MTSDTMISILIAIPLAAAMLIGMGLHEEPEATKRLLHRLTPARLRRRWVVHRQLIELDWQMLRASLALAQEHWRAAEQLIEEQDRCTGTARRPEDGEPRG